MGTVRLIVRWGLLLGWTLPLWGLRLALWPLARWDEARDRRLRRALVRVWARGTARIVGMRVETHGAPPAAPFFLVANHLSYVDIFLLQRATGCTFAARGDMASWPVFGWMARAIQVVFVDRDRREDAARANAELRHALAMGDAVVVFAESRITRGRAVEAFRSALIEPAAALGLPVHYATLSYRTAPGALPASTHVGWWRPEPPVHHLNRLLRQRGFTASIHFGAGPLQDADRKALARALTAAVRGPFVPVL